MFNNNDSGTSACLVPTDVSLLFINLCPLVSMENVKCFTHFHLTGNVPQKPKPAYLTIAPTQYNTQHFPVSAVPPVPTCHVL